ncbi:MAG TPA: mechanosensitive ion channel [Myxococcota bacterium]|nr:mechanosensitive ion channel [Myxococcota bacterium]
MNTPEILDGTQAVLTRELFRIGEHPIHLMGLITFVAILGVTYLASRLVQRLVRATFQRRRLQDEGTMRAVQRLLHYLVSLVGLGVALETMGINLTALFAAGALFAVAIGFAMQSILQNFVAGVILLMERTITPGDVLEVEGKRVRVVAMNIRTTIVRTRDEEELIVPNSILSQSVVKNLTLQDDLNRVRAVVGVTYDSDMKRVMSVLEQVATDLPGRESEPPPLVLLTDFGASSVNFEISVWTKNPWAARRMLSDLNQAIWWGLKDAGIVIAFPQLDVHLDPPVVNSLKSLAASQPRSAGGDRGEGHRLAGIPG